jgi:hypothetical protein
VIPVDKPKPFELIDIEAMTNYMQQVKVSDQEPA